MKDFNSIETRKKAVILRNKSEFIDNAVENQPIRLDEASASDKRSISRSSTDIFIRKEKTPGAKTGSHSLTQLHNFRSHHK